MSCFLIVIKTIYLRKRRVTLKNLPIRRCNKITSQILIKKTMILLLTTLQSLLSPLTISIIKNITLNLNKLTHITKNTNNIRNNMNLFSIRFFMPALVTMKFTFHFQAEDYICPVSWVELGKIRAAGFFTIIKTIYLRKRRVTLKNPTTRRGNKITGDIILKKTAVFLFTLGDFVYILDLHQKSRINNRNSPINKVCFEF